MIFKILSKYVGPYQKDEHHRYKSWEHCYTFFNESYKNLENKIEHASLHLAFYLASWGMLRGSSFLLQKDYLIHQYFIRDVVLNEKYHHFFEPNQPLNGRYIEDILEMAEQVSTIYKNHIQLVNGEKKDVHLTDTLITKILLGIYGNAPAYDRYLIDGLKLHGITGKLNEKSLLQLVEFYQTFENEFLECQQYVKEVTKINYPPMKLLDMYFWEVGYMLETNEEGNEEVRTFAESYKQREGDYREVTKGTNSEKRNSIKMNRIRQYIESLLNLAKAEGKSYIELVSGDIHRVMGLKNAMPSVCHAMRTLDSYNAVVIHETPSTFSSTNRYGYYLHAMPVGVK